MSSNTLDGLGRAVLERLSNGGGTPREIASTLDATDGAVHDRLAHLADNGLVREERSGRYFLTENGRRLLQASPEGRQDERIDTPPHVERAIEALHLEPDEAAALRKVFAYLRYWGDATTAEIIDAIYSEAPAGYRDRWRWWGECVEGGLDVLPDVGRRRVPVVGDRWLYEGAATTATPGDRDGREVGRPRRRPAYVGDVRHFLERQPLTPPERAAARCAFAVVHGLERVSSAELVDRCYRSHPAGYADPGAWLARMAETFEGIPTVERATTDAAPVWIYRPTWSGE